MKRFFAPLVTLLLFLTACGTPGLYLLEDELPVLMDITTQYPYTEKITVTDCASGEVREYIDGAAHDRIRMQFEGIQCIREKKNAGTDSAPQFEVTFYTTDGQTTVTILSASAYLIGEYRYDAMTSGVDLVYFRNLFAES
ncbi:MAG: hypothetical protein ACI4V1_10655 [Eubacteriales bacterium]